MNAPTLCDSSILIVDDDDSLRSMMVEFLEIEGFNATQAPNGRVALNLLEEGLRPCLVLLDLRMPVMSGNEFLEKVKASSDISDVNVLVVSANAGPDNTSGSIGYVKKPVDMDEVLRIAQRYCHKP